MTESVAHAAEIARTSPDDAEQYGRTKLSAAGATDIEVERITISGIRAARVRGIFPSIASAYRSVTVFREGHRHFEIVCSASSQPAPHEDPCNAVLGGLTVRRRDDKPVETPRAMRLTGEEFGVRFSPPDERWLGIGPRVGMSGAQHVWVWMLNGDQIDLQRLDVSVFPNYPEPAGLAEQFAAKIRAGGGTVRIAADKHGELPWTHLEASRSDGRAEDAFIHRTRDVVFTIHILQKKRDPSVIRQALAGFALVDATTRAAQPGVAPDAASPRR